MAEASIRAGSGPAPVAALAGVRGWINAARPRTLPLSIAPVALGTGAVRGQRLDGRYWLALLALAVALLLQIGVNFANDYSDGVRGTDRYRVGPARLTASGAARPRTVLIAAIGCFALSAVAGVAVVAVTGRWWLLALGAVSIAAAWFYTGGKRPYGYAGFGEVAVFLFFGLAATAGTSFVITGRIPADSWLCAVAIGAIASAVLVVNNLRDIEQDAAAGKRTLSVRIGARASRVLFGVLLAVPFVVLAVLVVPHPWAAVTFVALLLAVPAVQITATATAPPQLIGALGRTGMTALVYGLVLGITLAV